MSANLKVFTKNLSNVAGPFSGFCRKCHLKMISLAGRVAEQKKSLAIYMVRLTLTKNRMIGRNRQASNGDEVDK